MMRYTILSTASVLFLTAVVFGIGIYQPTVAMTAEQLNIMVSLIATGTGLLVFDILLLEEH